ncbi:hypothetical protein DSO57_1008729 [Entomophthora muscae]|uniref:Uncharacterized protein n=1 Tax=Entomophthora muscae TaxID=34485 RepID=A0ACC2TIK5_9FUNG|nr:hypothetical protein DSO57_1008729 [Entomophthora muscae]
MFLYLLNLNLNDLHALVYNLAPLWARPYTLSNKFKVFCEQTLPICALCSALGHREALCPTIIAGVQAAEQDTPKEHQNSETTGSQSNALVALAWGTMAEYAVVKKITYCQKKAHDKAQNLFQPQSIKETECAQEEAPQPMQTPAHETQAAYDNVVDEPMEITELAVQELMANLAQENLLQSQTQDTPNQEQAPLAQDNGRPRRKVQTKLAAVTKLSP